MFLRVLSLAGLPFILCNLHYESLKWTVESGKWRVESGKWKVENVKWRVESLHHYACMVGSMA
jgi:hypothetical protein